MLAFAWSWQFFVAVFCVFATAGFAWSLGAWVLTLIIFSIKRV